MFLIEVALVFFDVVLGFSFPDVGSRSFSRLSVALRAWLARPHARCFSRRDGSAGIGALADRADT